MLIVRRIGVDAARYYAHDVTGRWAGSGCAALGLDGPVGATELRRVLRGADPDGGAPLHPLQRNRRAGWDLVFAAPKSVSLLAAEGPGAAGDAIVGAHRDAVDDTLGWLEAHACFARRRSALIDAEGLVAARFGHRASSAGDPHLHDHVLVANLARAEGRWSAMDGSALWLQRRAVAATYDLGVRHHLLRRGLRFEWVLRPDGTFDMAGVPRAAIEASSRRRGQLLAAVGGRETTASAAAALRGSLRSDPRPDAERGLPVAWDPEGICRSAAGAASALGSGGQEQVAEGQRPRREAAPARWRETPSDPRGRDADLALAGEVVEHLAGTRSRYGPPDVMAALAAVHPDGVQAHAAHRWAVELCRVSIPCPDGRWTSPFAADADRRLAEAVDLLRGGRAGRVAAAVVDDVTGRRPWLGADAAADLRRLLLDGDGVVVVDARGVDSRDIEPRGIESRVAGSESLAPEAGWDPGVASGSGRGPGVAPAPAGRGAPGAEGGWVDQAAVLGAAADAWRAAGHRVAVVAPSASAERRWRALTGIEPATTEASPTVLVVDRADRCPPPTLGRLVRDAGESGAKVVLVEGGTLPARRRTLSEGLEEIGRRCGRLHPAPAWDREAADGPEPWAGIVRAWAASPDRPVLVGLGPAESDELNRRARAALAGQRHGDEVVVAGRPYAVGDRVLSLGSRAGRPAGTEGTVVAAGSGGNLRPDRPGRPAARPAVEVAWDDLSRSVVDHRRGLALGHAYATTPPMTRFGNRPLLVVGRAVDLGRQAGRVMSAHAVEPGGPEVGLTDRAVGRRLTPRRERDGWDIGLGR